MPRKTILESEILTGKIIQDLCLGLPISVIAMNHACSERHIYNVQSENEKKIRSKRRKALKDRQKLIDKFLEDETTDLLEVCRLSTMNLKRAIKAGEDDRLNGNKYVAAEIISKKDGKTIKSYPANDMEMAIKFYKETHSILAMFQKNADD